MKKGDYVKTSKNKTGIIRSIKFIVYSSTDPDGEVDVKEIRCFENETEGYTYITNLENDNQDSNIYYHIKKSIMVQLGSNEYEIGENQLRTIDWLTITIPSSFTLDINNAREVLDMLSRYKIYHTID
jgi:hypothetical protein